MKFDNALVLDSMLDREKKDQLTDKLIATIRESYPGAQVLDDQNGSFVVIAEGTKDELAETTRDMLNSFDAEVTTIVNETIKPTISAALAFTLRGEASLKELYFAADQLLLLGNNGNGNGNGTGKGNGGNAGKTSRLEVCELA